MRYQAREYKNYTVPAPKKANENNHTRGMCWRPKEPIRPPMFNNKNIGDGARSWRMQLNVEDTVEFGAFDTKIVATDLLI